jgi:flagellar hook-associated protein 3 FlgL
MRISTQTLFENGAARLGELQSGLFKTQQQIASGRRMLSPADDPVAAARALEVAQSQSINTQYGVNRQYAKSALGEVEVTLSSVTELLQEVRTTVEVASNTTLGDTDRAYMATALSGRLDQLFGLANSRDAMGNYMFSGFQTDSPAFSKVPGGVVSYDGDAGQRLLQVDASRRMSVTTPGSAVFQGGGQDVFDTLNDFIALLQTPGMPSATDLEAAKANLDLALESVSTVRASVGTRLQELDALDNAGEDRNLQYSQILSELQDLDYSQALTQLSQQQFTLEAAQRSFVTISGLSLFKLL